MVGFEASEPMGVIGERKGVIPPERVHYLSEIASIVREYHEANKAVSEKLRLMQHLETASQELPSIKDEVDEHLAELRVEVAEAKQAVEGFRTLAEEYASGEYTYHVRGKPFNVSP